MSSSTATRTAGPSRAVLLGYGSVNQHLSTILLEHKDRNLLIVGACDSGGAVYCAGGLDLDELLSLKGGGVSIEGYTGAGYTGDSQLAAVQNYATALEMVTDLLLGAAGAVAGSGAGASAGTGGGLLAALNSVASGEAGAPPAFDVLIDGMPANLQDGGPSLLCIRAALARGRSVVSANKAPLVLEYAELHALGEERGGQLGFSGTVCGGLPVVNVGRRDLFGFGASCGKLEGVLNSTTNHILTCMGEGQSAAGALADAQQRGIAEADPSMDVDGLDTACKLVIIANACLGMPCSLVDVDIVGISGVTEDTLRVAAKEGAVIKLVAEAHRMNVLEVEGEGDSTGGEEEEEGEEGGRGGGEDGKQGRHGEGGGGTGGSKGSDSDGKPPPCYLLTVGPKRVDRDSFLGRCDGTDMGVVFHTDLFETISMKTDEKGVFPTAAAVLRDWVRMSERARKGEERESAGVLVEE